MFIEKVYSSNDKVNLLQSSIFETIIISPHELMNHINLLLLIINLKKI